MSNRKHEDIFAEDIDWKEGTSPGIRYAAFMLDDSHDSSPLVTISTFEPGEVVAPHTHGASYLEYVISGEQQVGKKVFRAGDIRIAQSGVGYGPIRIGAQGCTVLIVFADARGANMIPLGKDRRDAALPEMD